MESDQISVKEDSRGDRPGGVFRVIFKLIVPLLLIGFVAHYVHADRERIIASLAQMDVRWFAGAFASYFLGVACIAINWRTILELLGGHCTWMTAFRSYYYSQLAKYIPGRIWGATSRIVLVRHEKIPEGTAALGVAIESILLMISASLVGFLAVGSIGQLPVEVRLLAIGAPLSVVMLHPIIFHRAVAILARRFPRLVLNPEHLPPFRKILMMALRFCLVWIFQGLGFWCVLRSLTPLGINSLLPVVGGNALAWLAGFVVVFTPAGLGVRELVLTRIFRGFIGSGPAALSAFTARFTVILSECTMSLILWIYSLLRDEKRYRRQDERNR